MDNFNTYSPKRVPPTVLLEYAKKCLDIMKPIEDKINNPHKYKDVDFSTERRLYEDTVDIYAVLIENYNRRMMNHLKLLDT